MSLTQERMLKRQDDLKQNRAAYTRDKRIRTAHNYQIALLLLFILVAGGIWPISLRVQQLNRNSALLRAISQADTRTIKRLLDEGADANVRDKPILRISNLWYVFRYRNRLQNGEDYDTALMLASQQDNPAPLQLLLDHGADANAREGFGQTALMMAVEKDNLAAMRLLLGRGVRVNLQDHFGISALGLTVAFKHSDGMRFLLAHGADVNTRDRDGMSVLCYVCAGLPADAGTVKLLLEHGADPNAKSKRGETPLTLAKGQPKILALLKHAGARL